MRKALIMLGQMSDGDIEWVARTSDRRTLPPSTTIIEEGQATQSLFIILDGSVSVVVNDTEIARLGIGEILGEISLIDARPPLASVVTRSETTVLVLDRAVLQTKLREDMGFGCRFYHAVAIFLAARLRDSVTRMGYGAPGALTSDEDLDDELDAEILDTLHLAGAKFDKLRHQTLRAR